MENRGGGVILAGGLLAQEIRKTKRLMSKYGLNAG